MYKITMPKLSATSKVFGVAKALIDLQANLLAELKTNPSLVRIMNHYDKDKLLNLNNDYDIVIKWKKAVDLFDNDVKNYETEFRSVLSVIGEQIAKLIKDREQLKKLFNETQEQYNKVKDIDSDAARTEQDELRVKLDQIDDNFQNIRNEIKQRQLTYKENVNMLKEIQQTGGKTHIQGGAMRPDDELTLVTMIVKYIVESGRSVDWKNVEDYCAEIATRWLTFTEVEIAGFIRDKLPAVVCATLHNLGMNVNVLLWTRIKKPTAGPTWPLGGPPDDPKVMTKDIRAQVSSIVRFYANANQYNTMTDSGLITRDPQSNIMRTQYNGRYDTILVRSIIFIQNVYRITQLALRRSQEDTSGNLIIEGISGTDEDLTEYQPTQSADGTLVRGNMRYVIDTPK